MRKKRNSLGIFLLVLLVAGLSAGGFLLWRSVDNRVQPLLCPVNPEYAGAPGMPDKVQGLALRPFRFPGWDGGEIQAVEVWKEGEESSRQLSVMGALATEPVERLQAIDYALVCVDWDHGILSALPLAESLTAAGLHCVLWNPRGVGDRRAYCTHGRKEAADVPHLLDALEKLSGNSRPVVVAVGQGYGANLLLRAASYEPRIRGLVSIDAFASLRQSSTRLIKGKALKLVMQHLVDMRIDSEIGMESFEVAPVQCASEIDRNVPVLVINLALDNPVSNMDDAMSIYRRLKSDKREIWAARSAEDDPEDTERKVELLVGQSGKEHIEIETVRLLQDDESAVPAILHWLNDCVVSAVEAPRPAELPRPVPDSDSVL
ncbi:MAG: alpha/beta hydrolase [Akkermansia sp.]|nr:alpha/beta hydrolase [Akkermansia sp.]